MATLFWCLVLLCAACVAVMMAADYRAARATSWDTIDHWLVAGSWAASAGVLTFGAAIGAGLAWVVS